MSRPSLTLSEAASACGVSRSTIRRKHESGTFPGAWKDAEGAWRVPVEDLLAAGLRPGRPSPPDAASAPDELPQAATVSVPMSEWDALRARAAAAEARAAAAEIRITDLDRALVTAEMALRAITAGPPATPSEVIDLRDTAALGASSRRRWWRRDRLR
jgi:hypothetical protein